MIDTLTDTLMALWNSTWRGKILPGLLAFIIVGICMSLFFLLIKSPAFLHQPSALNRSSKESGKSVSLALSPHHSGDVHATVVPTPMPTVVPTPTPRRYRPMIYPIHLSLLLRRFNCLVLRPSQVLCLVATLTLVLWIYLLLILSLQKVHLIHRSGTNRRQRQRLHPFRLWLRHQLLRCQYLR